MRKIVAFLLAICMVISLTACGGNNKPSGTETQPEQIVIRQYASAAGGQWYPMGTAINGVWEKYIPGVTTSLSPGAGGANVKTISNGEAEVAFSQAISVALASQGKDPFDKVYGGVCQLYACHPAGIHIVVLANSKINSLADLYDKNIGYGNVGEIHNAAIASILAEEYGITEESVIKNGGSVNYFGDGEAPAALADGQVDCILALGSWPRAALAEIEQNPGIRLISIEEDKLTHWQANHSDWNITTIPAGTYKGQNEDVKIICSYAIHIVNENMSEELAYQLTKQMWDHINEVYEASNDAKTWMKLEDALLAKDVVKLHPGAEKYYKEIGMIK